MVGISLINASAAPMLGGPQQSKYEVLQEAVANHGPEVKQL